MNIRVLRINDKCFDVCGLISRKIQTGASSVGAPDALGKTD